MAGTRLRVEFDAAVGTAISRQGDGVQVRLIKPLEVESAEALPAGTTLSGRVLAVRQGNKHTKTFPMIRLGFTVVTLPDGRSFPAKASLADLGVPEYVDSEGAASTVPPTKGGDVAVPVTTGAAGAGVGAIAGGGKGAAIGAGVGGAVGVLSDLAAHAAQWDDFTLKKGRKAWLRLDDDLSLSSPPFRVAEKPEIEGPSATAQLPQGSTTAPASATPPKSENKGLVYVEPAPKARFYRVDTEALLRDLNKAEVPLTINLSQADYVLRVWDDSGGFHAMLTGPDGRIAWADSAHTQAGITRAVVRYLQEHPPVKPQP